MSEWKTYKRLNQDSPDLLDEHDLKSKDKNQGNRVNPINQGSDKGSEWKTYKLGEVANINMGQSPKSETYTDDSSYIPFLQGNRTFGRYYPTYDTFCNKPIKIANEGDILMSVRAPVGDMNIADRKLCIGRGLCSISTKGFLDRLFLFYSLKNNVNRIINQQTGSVFGSINKTTLENIEIKTPNLPTQHQIASILSSLDDKIELTLQMNKTLEAMAQAIFKEWFVKFNFPGFDGELVDGLPKGWKIGKLNEIAKIEIGRTPPRIEEEWFSTDPKDIKWISIKDLGLSGVYIFNTSEYLTQEAVEKFRIPVIPENTVVLSFKLTIGRLAITTETMLSNEAIAQIKSDSFSPEYIYTYLKTYNWGTLGSTSSIATAINSKIIKEMEVLIPDSKIEKHFQEVIKPIFEKLKTNSQEIETLTQIRDSLLPKLMTGKIEIQA